MINIETEILLKRIQAQVTDLEGILNRYKEIDERDNKKLDKLDLK